MIDSDKPIMLQIYGIICYLKKFKSMSPSGLKFFHDVTLKIFDCFDQKINKKFEFSKLTFLTEIFFPRTDIFEKVKFIQVKVEDTYPSLIFSSQV